MTDPVEALAAAIEDHSHVGAPSEDVIGCGRGHVERCSGRIIAALRASGFDVVPTGDAGLDDIMALVRAYRFATNPGEVVARYGDIHRWLDAALVARLSSPGTPQTAADLAILDADTPS